MTLIQSKNNQPKENIDLIFQTNENDFVEKVIEESDHYGEYTIEQKVEKHFGPNKLVMFRVDHNKYEYQRFQNGNLVVEKILASDRSLALGIFPIAPINTPSKYGHLLNSST